jgi:hypothetical protein
MNARHEAVGLAYERGGRLYADPDSLAKRLVCPPSGSWNNQISENDSCELLKKRVERNRLSAADYYFWFGNPSCGPSDLVPVN